MLPQSKIETGADFNGKVMRRVKIIFYVKKIVNPITLESAGLLMFSLTIFYLTSVKNIINNAPSIFENTGEASKFWVTAFVDTELLVQTIVVGVVIISSLLAAKTIKKVIYLAPNVREWGQKLIHNKLFTS